jgi:hypothetical protein
MMAFQLFGQDLDLTKDMGVDVKIGTKYNNENRIQ